jgi:hypothetical protein
LPAEDNCLGNRNNVGVQCEALAESAFYAHQHKEPQLTILNSLQSFPPIPPLHPLSEDALKEILAENLNPNNNDQETEKLMRDFKTSRPTLLPLVKKTKKKKKKKFSKNLQFFSRNLNGPLESIDMYHSSIYPRIIKSPFFTASATLPWYIPMSMTESPLNPGKFCSKD